MSVKTKIGNGKDSLHSSHLKKRRGCELKEKKEKLPNT